MVIAQPNAPPSAAAPRAAATRVLIDRRLARSVCAVDDVQALLDLSAEAVAPELVEAAGQRAIEILDSHEFEVEIRLGPDVAGVRLRRLAALRVRFNASVLTRAHQAAACAILGRLERLIHADAPRPRTGPGIQIIPAPG